MKIAEFQMINADIGYEDHFLGKTGTKVGGPTNAALSL